MDTKRDTPKYYKDAPTHLYAKLFKFRTEHQIKRFEFNGKTIEYIATGKIAPFQIINIGVWFSVDDDLLSISSNFRPLSNFIAPHTYKITDKSKSNPQK